MPVLFLDVEVDAGEVTILRPRGAMDSATVPILEEAVQKVVRGGARRLVFDGTHLEYMSSDGLGGLLQYIPLLRHDGGDLKLANLHGKAAVIVEVLGLDRILQVFPSVVLAVRAFQRPLPPEMDGAVYFLATGSGGTVHRPECRYVRTKSDSALHVYHSLSDARKRGKTPCRVCRPR